MGKREEDLEKGLRQQGSHVVRWAGIEPRGQRNGQGLRVGQKGDESRNRERAGVTGVLISLHAPGSSK